MDRPNSPCLFLAVLMVMFSGVASCSDQEITETSSADQLPKKEPAEPISDREQPLDVDNQVSIARQDLARRLGVDTDEIEIETVRQVHWRSGAAGCPEPGMSYTMALVPGVLIMLRADEEIYRYHAGRYGMPSYCPADRAEAPALGLGEEAM